MKVLTRKQELQEVYQENRELVGDFKPKKRRKQKQRASEIRLLREIAWWYFRDKKCYFCKERFIEDSLARQLTFGHRHHKPFRFKLSNHHRDEDREHNDDSNLRWAHSNCHKAHHMKKAQKIMKNWKVYLKLTNGSKYKNPVTIRCATKETAKHKIERRSGDKVVRIVELKSKGEK